MPRDLGLRGPAVRRGRPAPRRAADPGRAQPGERGGGDRRRPRRWDPDDAIAEALATFPGVEHRLETVAEIGGVRYVNDSKATNVAAASRALAAYEEPLHVILGGSLKGEDFSALTAALGSNVRALYLIGEAADQLEGALAETGIPIERSGDLATAVTEAAANAREGEIVLLSPACASFDQFRDFEHRGEEFRRLVQNLEG